MNNNRDNSRRSFVKNIGMFVAGLSVGPVVASTNSNHFEPARARVAAFGYGDGWRSFTQQLKRVTKLNCICVHKIEPGTNAGQEIAKELNYIFKTTRLDGILLYHPQQGWEPLAETILMHKLHLFVQAPVPNILQPSRRLALLGSEHTVFQWHPMPNDGSTEHYADLPQRKLFTDVRLWEKVIAQLPLEEITQVDGHMFTKTDSFHILYHFGSGPNKKIWQWFKGEFANNLLPGIEVSSIARHADQVIISTVEPAFNKTRDASFTSKKQFPTATTHFSAMNETSIMMERWAQNIMDTSRFSCSDELFSVAKLHQLGQLLFLKETVLNGFPHYKPLNPCSIQYPTDYLCLPWDASLLRFNAYKDLNTWVCKRT